VSRPRRRDRITEDRDVAANARDRAANARDLVVTDHDTVYERDISVNALGPG
jgi:hypothetical protein